MKNDKKPIHVAYTNERLALHSDLCYFDSVPTVQIMHCLINKVEGGLSGYADTHQAIFNLKKRKNGEKALQIL